jgi:hypothetical protein
MAHNINLPLVGDMNTNIDIDRVLMVALGISFWELAKLLFLKEESEDESAS